MANPARLPKKSTKVAWKCKLLTAASLSSMPLPQPSTSDRQHESGTELSVDEKVVFSQSLYSWAPQHFNWNNFELFQKCLKWFNFLKFLILHRNRYVKVYILKAYMIFKWFHRKKNWGQCGYWKGVLWCQNIMKSPKMGVFGPPKISLYDPIDPIFFQGKVFDYNSGIFETI